MVWVNGWDWHGSVSNLPSIPLNGTSRANRIVVLLLGKLQLTPSRALKAYEALARFIPVKPIQSEEERKVITDAFTRAFTEVLEDAGLPTDAPMNSRSENGEITKT
jgi:hypothetical protein